MPEEYKEWFVGKLVRSYFEECPKDKLPAYPETFEQDREDDECGKIHSDHAAKKQSVRITIVGYLRNCSGLQLVLNLQHRCQKTICLHFD